MSTDLVGLVRQNLEAIRGRIRRAGGDPERITVVGVTKGQGPEAVRAALATGLTEIGENYAGELLAKAEALGAVDPPIRWHFLGAVQRNKVPRLAPVVACWQGVGREEEAVAVGRRRPGAELFVEVRSTDDPGRPGCPPEQAAHLVEVAQGAGCRVRGLMTVAPAPSEGTDRASEAFARLAALAADLGLAELSMGMTDDLEQAVAAGTTMLRIGRALFGERPAAGPREAGPGLQQ